MIGRPAFAASPALPAAFSSLSISAFAAVSACARHECDQAASRTWMARLAVIALTWLA